MRIAITRWGTRVAPLFDTARKILIVDVKDNDLKGSNEIDIDGIRPFSRAGYLVGAGIP